MICQSVRDIPCDFTSIFEKLLVCLCQALYDLLKDKADTALDLSKAGEAHIGANLTTLLGSDFNVARESSSERLHNKKTSQ